MESKLHELIREVVGGGEWTDECSRIWNKIEEEIKSRTETLESANNGWQKHCAELEKCKCCEKPVIHLCPECALQTVQFYDRSWLCELHDKEVPGTAPPDIKGPGE